jgi:hypothetical protein
MFRFGHIPFLLLGKRRRWEAADGGGGSINRVLLIAL